MRREQRQAQAVVADQAQTIKSLQIINNRLNDRVVELSKLRRSVSDKYKDMELQIKKLSLENASLKDEICRLVVQVRSLQREDSESAKQHLRKVQRRERKIVQLNHKCEKIQSKVVEKEKVIPKLDKQITSRTRKIWQLTTKQKLLREDLRNHNLKIKGKDDTIEYLDNRVAELEEMLEEHRKLLAEKQCEVATAGKSVLVSSEVPTWMQIMHQSKRIRFTVKGKEFWRVKRFPNQLMMSSINATVNHNVEASQVPGLLRDLWKPFVPNLDEYDLGERIVHNNYRRMIPWLCRVQAGWELTESYWRCQGDKMLGQTLLGDGTEKNRMHYESAVLQLDNGKRICIIPWLVISVTPHLINFIHYPYTT